MNDPIRDPELERMLGRLSGAYPDTNVAVQAVHTRVRQVKRRRAFVASTAACAMLFGVAAVAAQGVGRSQTVSPAAPIDSSVGATESSVAPSSTAPGTDASSSVPDTSTVTTAVDTSVVDTSAPVTTVANSAVDTTATTNAPATTAAPVTSIDGSSTSGPSTSVTLPQGEHTWSSNGGSVTVSNDNGVLTLLDATPAAGFTETRHEAGSSRIRVEFSNGTTTWRIEIRTDGGKARAEISQHG